MIKFKKVAGILTAAVVAASLFSGCGEIAGKSDVTKITMWSGNSHSKSVMEEVAKKFNDTVGKEKKIYFDYVIKEGGSLSQAIDVFILINLPKVLSPQSHVSLFAQPFRSVQAFVYLTK